MDKRGIKEFAINARQKLMAEVRIKANQLGIFAEKIEEPIEIEKSLHEFASGVRIGQKEINQRQKLVAEIQQRAKLTTSQEAFETVMEEVAYTWFNRLIAIRFMEVNHYLPEDIRVLSSEQGKKTEPDIVTDLLATDLAEAFTEAERQQVVAWKLDGSSESMDALYQFTFIKVCNDLNHYLPQLFEKIDDYTELLFTASYINQDGVIKDLQALSETSFDVSQGGQVEIIGWLYQYYNTEPKDKVFSRLKTQKIEKNDIPAATQLFTPNWIVKYMVENSLGRFYIDKLLGTPSENRNEEEIAKSFGWKYYLPNAEQVESVQLELRDSQKAKANYTIENIKFIDPSMGSGHILVYAFELFMQLYNNEGYSSREAASLIIANNLFGLDIDERARQLAYFAVMMKAREYDRLALKKNLKPNVFDVEETGDLKDEVVIRNFASTLETKELRESLRIILDKFEYGKTLGSLIKLPADLLYDELLKQLIRYQEGQDIFASINEEEVEKLRTIIKTAKLLSNNYEIVVTNPPHMGSSGMAKQLGDYVKREYPNSKSDLFAVFIERWNNSLMSDGLNAMVTMQSWMFLSSYEKMRMEISENYTILSLMHLDNMVMGIAFGTAVTIYSKNKIGNWHGTYHQVTLKDLIIDEPIAIPIKSNRYGVTSQEAFSKIPGSPIAYWASEELLRSFETGTRMDQLVDAKQGLATADNNRFLRYWWEIEYNNIKFDAQLIEESVISGKKWFPYNKGGAFRRWYGNYDYVVNWENDGDEIRHFADEKGKIRSRPQNTDFYFKEALTWSDITSGPFSLRYRESGSIHDVKGMSAFTNDRDNMKYLLGLMNSPIANHVFKMLNPTISLQIGNFQSFPVIDTIEDKAELINIVDEAINISKKDWDVDETSWNFSQTPWVMSEKTYLEKSQTTYERFIILARKRLIEIEERLNQEFIEVYNLQAELPVAVNEEYITLKNLNRERDIKSFISYAVGVMFGRYSLDEEGLIYAGGEWDSSKYRTFIPDQDNLLIISDDKYFNDSSLDIVNRFIEFVDVVYSPETLEENLAFIAEALGGKGDSRHVIRNYFVKHFYKDHLQVYSKRPIYWQFDSGKQNGFKALMYLHRYDQDTLGKVRTDYLHELQKAYDSRLELRKQQIEASELPKEKVVWQKEIEKLEKQRKEARDYDEKLGHLALKRIFLDLDDGVIVNYDKLQCDPETGEKYQILSKGPNEPKK